MLNRITAIVLSALFLLFLTAPTVIMMIDETSDVSAFYAASEEEEKKGQEKDVDKLLVLNPFLNGEYDFDLGDKDNNSQYFIKRYWRPYINIISPPPESFTL
ncbi:hypothetical protein [Hyunsoonleella rubra]|uniref:Uncharacterized protein n=1 Tax=Hyunsoonleella rubra TaxID=1737062 RepID=A0ABW5T8W3_9FLAO